MEPESLGLEDKHSEVQELDLTGGQREVTDVLTLEEIANLAAEEGSTGRDADERCRLDCQAFRY